MTGAFEPSGRPARPLHRPLATALLAAWLLLCALLPISGNLVPVPLGCAILLAAVHLAWYRPVIAWRMLWPIPAWYLLHVAGMLWTTNMDFGLFDLQVKLGMVLLPLMAALALAVHPDLLRHGMSAFTLGTAIAILLSVWKGWECYRSTGDPGCFAQTTFSFELHPSYAAWYACWAMAWWCDRAMQDTAIRPRLFHLSIALVMLIFIVMLASKSGVIGALLVIVVMAVRWLRSFVSGRWAIKVGLAAVAVAAVFASSGGGLVVARMEAAFRAVEMARHGDPALYSSHGGSEMRLVAWQCSTELLMDHPMGSGTGDVKDELVGCYTAKGATDAMEKRLNAHCQFLQGGAALGWPGFILTLLIGLVPLRTAVIRRNVLLGTFAALFFVNAAVESILEVQAGVVFMGLMLGLLAHGRTSCPPHARKPHRP